VCALAVLRALLLDDGALGGWRRKSIEWWLYWWVSTAADLMRLSSVLSSPFLCINRAQLPPACKTAQIKAPHVSIKNVKRKQNHHERFVLFLLLSFFAC
jgi:hypothetical protein